MRLFLLVLLACPAAFATPLKAGEATFSLRLEGLIGQPTTLLPIRGGGALGIGWRMTDQLGLTADVGQRAAPGGGISVFAVGMQATIDMTPVAPWLELSMVEVTNRDAAGFTLATRTSFGADWAFTPRFAVGVVVRQFVAFDPLIDGTIPGGTEAALRFVFTPGGK